MSEDNKKRGNYEKPVELDMSFNEALARLIKVRKEEIEQMKKEEDKPGETNNDDE